MRIALFAGLIITGAHSAAADPPAAKADPRAEVRARVEKYLGAATPGVFYREDKDTTGGTIARVFVVGVSPVSTVLGPGEGLEVARERAAESAKAEFVTWLGSKVAVRRTVTNEVLLTREGAETAAGGTATREAGKRVERRTKEFEEAASGLVRGLRVAGARQDGKEKTYVLVYTWEAKSVAGVGRVSDQLNAPPDDPKLKGGPAGTTPAPKKAAQPIPDKKVVIDD